MSSHTKNLPIGVFDSGIGGLTVLRALREILPYENFLYLGDTARLPYGTKSADTVREYALNANEILFNQGIKTLVIACNTATALALESVQEKFSPLPVLGVIDSGAQAAISHINPGPILVLATEGTAKGHAYRNLINQWDPTREVIEWPCSLLVALAEEGWCDGELVEKIIAQILAPLLTTLPMPPSCVVLGCTHFPVLKNAIQNVFGTPIPIIDPAHRVALEVKKLLVENQQLHEKTTKGNIQFMATDGIERFARVAQTFLGFPIAAKDVELVCVNFNARVLDKKFG